ncbi:MAG TPA: hypothetical protein VEI07_22105, partial [Planctomycetaceae bacterium]|nr:hypothetical protein [Planctomycetaceae bacterium]
MVAIAAWRQWFNRVRATRPARSRRKSVHRRRIAVLPSADVLEARCMLSATPSIVTSGTLGTGPAPETEVVGSGALKDNCALEGGDNPTGTIAFTLYSPSDTVVDSESVTCDGNGDYSSPNGYVPTAPGTYQWQISYSGDANNNPVTTPLGSVPVTVSKAQPGLTTAATPSTEVVGSGTLKDIATLSGGFNPTGTMTFSLESPSGTIVDTETVTVTGDGDYSTPDGVVPTAVGTYQWSADYSGDANNYFQYTATGEEPVVVSPKAQPGLTTAATPSTEVVGSGTLKDIATLSGGNNPTGTMTFSLESPSGTIVDTETVTVTGDGDYSTPDGYVPTAPGTYQWVDSYSGDANNYFQYSPSGSEP